MHSAERPSRVKVETGDFRKGVRSFVFNQAATV